MECKSSKTTDLKSEIRMLTRSRVDENTVLFSGVSDKTGVKAILALSGDIIGSSQTDAYIVDDEQTIISKDVQESNGQHPVSSKQQVDKPLILPCELEVTTEIKTDVNVTTAINHIIGDEFFSKQSPSNSFANDVRIDKPSYPETLKGCLKIIDKLHQEKKILHLTIVQDEHLLRDLKTEAQNAQHKLNNEYKERRYWKTEYHRVNREVRRSGGQGRGSRTGFQISTEVGRDERQRSKSREPATLEVDSRQSNRRPADQKGVTSRPSYNMNRVFHGVRRDGKKKQSRDGEERHPWTNSRGAHPRRGLQPSFVQGEWGASKERNNNTLRGQTKLGQKRGEGCFQCDNLGRCTKGTCPASDVTCKICSKVGHFPFKCL